ncbi:MAG: LPS export ABC transporter permease LptG [Bdellovibrionales bacterium]|nr:LPS export ABC transporter permease LptG [Bdellovibrionales bacterium]
MGILDRYIASEFLKGFLAALATFLVLYLGADTLRQGMKDDIPAAHALQYTLYQLPEVIVLLTPAACLMGTLICLSGFARRNELTAMHASGLSLGRISLVVLSLVFMICCTSFMVTDRVIPPLNKMKDHFYRTVIQKKPDLQTDIRHSKIWYRSKNLVYNLRSFDPRTKNIFGVSVYTFDSAFNLVQQLDAERAEFIDGVWRLRNGMATIFEGEPKFPVSQRFTSQSVALSETPDDFLEIEREVQTLRLKHLWRFIQRNKDAGIDTHSYEVTFWSKISLSLVPLIMSVLGIPFATQHHRHSSLARDVSLCFLIVVVYWILFSTGLSMGKSGRIPPLLAAFAPSLLFFSAGVWLIRKGRRI